MTQKKKEFCSKMLAVLLALSFFSNGGHFSFAEGPLAISPSPESSIPVIPISPLPLPHPEEKEDTPDVSTAGLAGDPLSPSDPAKLTAAQQWLVENLQREIETQTLGQMITECYNCRSGETDDSRVLHNGANFKDPIKLDQNVPDNERDPLPFEPMLHEAAPAEDADSSSREEPVVNQTARLNSQLFGLVVSFVLQEVEQAAAGADLDPKMKKRIKNQISQWDIERIIQDKIDLWVEGQPALAETVAVEGEKQNENVSPAEVVQEFQIMSQGLNAIHALRHPPDKMHPYLRWLFYRRYLNEKIITAYESFLKHLRKIYAKAKTGEGFIRFMTMIFNPSGISVSLAPETSGGEKPSTD